MARRLTERQKLQIAKGYREGKSSMLLAQEFGCSANTVVRTVKSLLSEDEYIALKASRMKEENFTNNGTFDEDCESNGELKDSVTNDSIIINENAKNDDDLIKLDQKKFVNEDINSFNNDLKDSSIKEESIQIDSSHEDSSVFKEFVPLLTDFGFEDREQKVNLQSLSSAILPETVYILVDKKVELECIHLSDLTDWSFLPDLEKERKVIPLFSSQREAKRSCSRSQRVIKIPNTKIFTIAKPYLLSKGITRLVVEDSLISIDN